MNIFSTLLAEKRACSKKQYRAGAIKRRREELPCKRRARKVKALNCFFFATVFAAYARDDHHLI
jgi:hypothetical protein